jgi:hypothetical protein
MGGSGGTSGVSGSGGTGGSAAIDGGDNRLVAEIQAQPSGLVVTMVTVGCSGECADVIAVASGGNPEYAFVWNDGITTAAREICALDTTTFRVTVSDTPIVDPEFPYDGASVTAEVTANVVACPSDGGVDAGPNDELCIQNASFEGTPARNLFGTTFDAAPWHVCSVTPDIVNAVVDVQFPTATDGQTYLGLLGDSAALTESIGQALCAPLRAGTNTFLQLDTTGDGNDSLRLQIFGASTDCGEEQLLVEIDPNAPVGYPAWTTHCMPIAATSDVAFLKIKATGSGGPYVLVDNLRAVAACP